MLLTQLENVCKKFQFVYKAKLSEFNYSNDV